MYLFSSYAYPKLPLLLPLLMTNMAYSVISSKDQNDSNFAPAVGVGLVTGLGEILSFDNITNDVGPTKGIEDIKVVTELITDKSEIPN